MVIGPPAGRSAGGGKSPLDNVRRVMADLDHVHRHALQAADQASECGAPDVTNYHLGRASALRDALDRLEQALQ
jgi:isoaspartyl peptidase/L-asparaginase-like protein (Ntn-hydrolase superfamily)